MAVCLYVCRFMHRMGRETEGERERERERERETQRERERQRVRERDDCAMQPSQANRRLHGFVVQCFEQPKHTPSTGSCGALQRLSSRAPYVLQFLC